VTGRDRTYIAVPEFDIDSALLVTPYRVSDTTRSQYVVVWCEDIPVAMLSKDEEGYRVVVTYADTDKARQRPGYDAFPLLHGKLEEVAQALANFWANNPDVFDMDTNCFAKDFHPAGGTDA